MILVTFEPIYPSFSGCRPLNIGKNSGGGLDNKFFQETWPIIGICHQKWPKSAKKYSKKPQP